MEQRYTRLFIFIAFSLFFASCSVTKHLPEEELLYTGIKGIEISARDSSAIGENTIAEIEAALAYPPNNALLGSSSVRIPFPFGLWMYNALINKEGKIGKWMFRKLAAKPVYISTVNPEVRVKVAQNLLKEYGYFRGEADFELVPHEKDPKQAGIRYLITMRKPYTLDSIRLIRRRHRTDTIVRQRRLESLLKKGDNFNVTVLEAERQRISALLRNNGYYYFRPDYIVYEADTTRRPEHVDLRLRFTPGMPREALRPWGIGDISVYLNGYDNEPPTDSVRYRDLTLYYEGKLRVRPAALYRRLHLHTGERFTATGQERTQTALSRLGIFRYAELQFSPKDTTARCDTLQLRINTAYDLPLDGELELNVTTKSNDQTGPGAIFSVTKHNIFGGGETFGVQLKGSYEWQTGNRVDGASSVMNSYELGLSSTLTLPQLFFPGYLNRETLYPSSTTFRVYADQMNRAKFFKMLSFGGSATLEFQTSATSHHSIVPFKLAYNKLQKTTAEFDSIVGANRALGLSLQDQFVPSMSYTYTYDDSPLTDRRHHIWWQTSFTQAGNILAAGYAIAGKGFNVEGKQLFGNPFAQFVKLTSEIRYNYQLKKRHNLVGRLMAGVIYGYGNAQNHATPYNEQFYIGGANSIRAFTIRSIGPGRFIPDAANQYGYIDQTGDLKLEANLEYRFPIFGDLYGAAFLDAGNIWTIHDDPSRPGGQMKWGRFLKDLALGTGLGLRYDLQFLVVRIDCGVALHVPYDTGKSGYYNIPNFRDGLGVHLAIGYPF